MNQANSTTTLNFINGQYCDPVSDGWLENINPADGTSLGKIANSTEQDVERAVIAAANAQPQWSESTLEQRSRILSKIGDLIEENLESLAIAESEDSGKPIGRARTIEIPRAASNFHFFANAITQFSSESHESVGQNAINFTLRQPLGVVGCISPWNLPLYLFTWKIAPALAAGNCVIAKPSELTPRTAAMLGELCNQAGLPAGVLNIIQGEGPRAGQALLEHEEVKAISFTGGTATGEHVARVVAPKFKKLSLELGGKNPNIIFADCNYERALETTIHSSFANQGQICLCGSRIFVESSIYEKFKSDLIARTTQLTVSHPANEETAIGAMVSGDHYRKVLSYFDEIDPADASILCGGKPATVEGYEQGFYIEPTIIEVQNNQCRLNQEEIFGPVVTLMPFDNEEDLITMANDVKYGLSATIWTKDLDRTMRLSKKIECGVVWINTWLMRDLRTPFGGMKNSGVGREGGLEALRFFTEPKNICIAFED
ncbi:MAG: aldehyde dehydrogenase [Planctomycetaceae bacterium]|nr:aldehyde dehydrogenase [Planctomycetaceae bacterium]MCP4773838.1 aldehyde dehydrogenase [Planctomycetaceae bacterium]